MARTVNRQRPLGAAIDAASLSKFRRASSNRRCTDRLPPFGRDLEACDLDRPPARAYRFDARRRKAGVEQANQHRGMDAVREQSRVGATVRVAGEKFQGAATAIGWVRHHGIVAGAVHPVARPTGALLKFLSTSSFAILALEAVH